MNKTNIIKKFQFVIKRTSQTLFPCVYFFSFISFIILTKYIIFSFIWPLPFTNDRFIPNFLLLQPSTVINKCKKLFSQFGTPKDSVTDNGPEFTSHYFKSFSRTWDFEHRTISLHFHQSNGLVERAIQTVKHTLKKAKIASEDHYLTILFWIPNLTKMDCHQLISYSIAQSALM